VPYAQHAADLHIGRFCNAAEYATLSGLSGAFASDASSGACKFLLCCRLRSVKCIDDSPLLRAVVRRLPEERFVFVSAACFTVSRRRSGCLRAWRDQAGDDNQCINGATADTANLTPLDSNGFAFSLTYLDMQTISNMASRDRVTQHLDAAATGKPICAASIAQGENRFVVRANALHAAGRLARCNGSALGRKLLEVPAGGHDAAAMFGSPQAAQALGLGGDG